MSAYSFMDVTCTLSGPSGEFDLGYGSSNAEEGISIDMIEDKNTMLIGADGNGMHSLHAGRAGTITVRLLKTSPMNAKLSAAYDMQSMSSALWGKNVMVVRQTASGDQTIATDGAFKRKPNFNYAKDGDIIAWAFDFIKVDGVLGTY